MSDRRTRSSACILAAAVLLASAHVRADEKGEDWLVELTGAGAEPVAETGVIGMSAEDLAAYAAEAHDQADTEVPENFIRNRRRFVIREIRINSDWDTDPTALPSLIDQFKRQTGMDGQALQPRQPLAFDDLELFDWPFLYVTAHNAFTLSDAEIKGLRRYCDNGGFFYAGDCLYGFPFGQSFPGEMRKVYPDRQLQIIDINDPVLGMVLKQKFSWPKVNEAGLPWQFKPNAWKCITVDGRMAILYTPQDIGCAWEISSPPTPSNPLGGAMHNLDRIPGLRKASYELGINIILYSMMH